MPRRWPLLLGLVLGLAAIQLGLQSGSDETEAWQLAARWTARAGFPLLIVTYSASSLARLKRNGLTKALMRDRRWWGIGFAACHTTHLFALWRYLTLSGEHPPMPVLIGGGAAYALLYAMVLTSNAASIRVLGRNWKLLHRAGIHYLWVVFALNYVGAMFTPDKQAIGLIYGPVALAGLGLRIFVWRRTRRARKGTGGCSSCG